MIPRIAALVAFLVVSAAAQEFFPRGVLEPKPDNDQFAIDWYSKNLRALEEPSLLELSQADRTAEVYRFLLLPTFTSPVSIRITFDADGSASLIEKTATGTAGNIPGRLDKTTKRHLSPAEVRKITDAISSGNFWKISTNAPPITLPATITMDGEVWIIEGVRLGEYHVVHRYAPLPKDPTAVLGAALSQITHGKKRSNH